MRIEYATDASEPLIDIEAKVSSECIVHKEESTSLRRQQIAELPVFQVLQVPWVKTFLGLGFGWDLARASLTFVGPFYVNAETHDAFLAELVGAASWMFLVMGPLFGYVSDRHDRKSLILLNLSAMSISTLFVSMVIFSGNGSWQLMFFQMPILSMCAVLDTTTRMPYISALLTASDKEHLLGTLLAIRTTGYNIARVAGCQVPGIIIDYFGLGVCMMGIALCLIFGTALSVRLPQVGVAKTRNSGPVAESTTNTCSRAFVSVFGVTVIANFFYWSYQPLIPRIGSDLHASPSHIGLLASGPFWGGLIVSFLLMGWCPRQTGVMYCVGITVADLLLAGGGAASFMTAFWYLFFAGAFASLFGTVQMAMVISMVPDELRGRATGLLTLAIGAGPFGNAALGKTAAWLGASATIRYFGLLGAACQVVWLLILPDALYITSARP